MGLLFSVIVCSHNPRPEYLRRVLDALRAQSVQPDSWELILVDSASREPLALTWDLSWHSHARHVREGEAGVTRARLRGLAEAAGELLVFVDDDNVVASDFLARADEIRMAHPYIGVFGSGRLEPEFEVPPPAELSSRLTLLALRTVPAAVWSNNPNDYSCIPWSAGMILTRRVAGVYRQLLARLNLTGIVGRRGPQLASGEDDLISWAASAAGLGFGIFPELRVTHLVAARRLTRAYFLRLLHDTACSNGIMHYLLANEEQHHIDGVRLARVLLHGLRNGAFSMRCQWAVARGEAAAARFVEANRLEPFPMRGSWLDQTAV